jgi:hypothetical protein
MNTILDIQKSGFPNIEKKYVVETLEELFEAIEDALKINPLIEEIKVKKTDKLNIQDLIYNHGFDFFYYNSDGKIRFRGFTKWVYFKNDNPVFFDSSCSGTDTQPHTSTFRHQSYTTLDFDRCEKIIF